MTGDRKPSVRKSAIRAVDALDKDMRMLGAALETYAVSIAGALEWSRNQYPLEVELDETRSILEATAFAREEVALHHGALERGTREDFSDALQAISQAAFGLSHHTTLPSLGTHVNHDLRGSVEVYGSDDPAWLVRLIVDSSDALFDLDMARRRLCKRAELIDEIRGALAWAS